MGKRLCFHTLDTKTEGATIVPAFTRPSRERVNDTAPVTRWAYDALDPAGEQRFRETVEGINVQCAALDN